MGAILKQGGNRPGDFKLNSADALTNKYFGGQPLCQDANGVRLCKAADRAKFVGLACVSSYEDLKTGVVTVLMGGGSIVRLMASSASQDNTDAIGNVVEGAPYDTSLAFVEGQRVYIDANGFFTNVAASGAAIGTVTKGQGVNDDSIEIELNPTMVD